ncbi:MAG: hypothetical protein JNK45_25000, partial [Myxococcales bacterium]|nr:hypothetical protein [Myxococcales bacterium]
HSPQTPPSGPTTKQKLESHCRSRSHIDPFGRPPGSPVEPSEDPSDDPPDDPVLDSVLAPVLDDSSTAPELDSVLVVLGSAVTPELPLSSAVVSGDDVDEVSTSVPEEEALTEASDIEASDAVDVDPDSDAVAAAPSSEQPTSHAKQTTQLR